jgi:hypothetical protein
LYKKGKCSSHYYEASNPTSSILLYTISKNNDPIDRGASNQYLISIVVSSDCIADHHHGTNWRFPRIRRKCHGVEITSGDIKSPGPTIVDRNYAE